MNKYCICVGFILCLLVLFPISIIKRNFILLQTGSACINQNIIMKVLSNHIDSGGDTPQNLADLHFPKEIKDIFLGTYYYADAWDKPGRILLCKPFPLLRSYVVTFSDGSNAILSNWSYSRHLELDNEIYPKHLFSFSPMANLIEIIWFILLIIVLCVVLRLSSTKSENHLVSRIK